MSLTTVLLCIHFFSHLTETRYIYRMTDKNENKKLYDIFFVNDNHIILKQKQADLDLLRFLRRYS